MDIDIALSRLPAHFVEPGDRVLLLGEDHGEHGGSAWLRLLYEIEQGRPPEVDLEREKKLAELLRILAYRGIARTIHDLSDGGLAVALAESCFGRGLGVELEVPLTPPALFSETQARALVAVPRLQMEAALRVIERAGVPYVEAGQVGGERLKVKADGGTLDVDVAELHQAWATALPRALGL